MSSEPSGKNAVRDSMKKPKRSRTVNTPRGRPGSKASADAMNQATTAEFDREDMGVAPKE